MLFAYGNSIGKRMKILYFGYGDEAAENILQQLVKEGHKVSCVISNARKAKKIKCKVYEYQLSKFDTQIQSVMKFVKPDAIVFAGRIMDNKYLDEQMGDFTQMQRILQCAEENAVRKFVYLSSLESIQDDEKSMTDWGVYHAQQECMIGLFERRSAMDATILRCGPVYYGAEKFSMNAAAEVFEGNAAVQPIHVKDIAVAVSRLIDENRGHLELNVCGSTAFCLKSQNGTKEMIPCDIKYSNEEVKRLINWTDFYVFKGNDHMLAKEKKPLQKEQDSKGKNKKRVRQFAENLALFLLFLIPLWLMRDHRLFQNIDWMLIYIVVVSLYLGMLQSTVAVGLACVMYLILNRMNILQITNIYSYLQYLIVIAEYIFFGIAVGYSNNMIRNKLHDMKMDYDLLNSDHQDLKTVFEQSSVVMEEYEQRMLDSQETLPKLQSIMSRLNVLQPGKIFMEINYVIKDLLKTNTVAVYQRNGDSDYLRLLSSLNEESAVGGKSWNLGTVPEIKEQVLHNEIAMGANWTEEPGMTIPIFSENQCIAVIVVKNLSMETRSLYYINMMRTLSGLISDAMGRALDYEKLTEDRRYMENTTVLTADEFKKQIELQEEFQKNKIASFTMLCIQGIDWRSNYQKVDSALRTVDYIGINEKEELCVVLVNTSKEECSPVLERLSRLGIEAQICE